MLETIITGNLFPFSIVGLFQKNDGRVPTATLTISPHKTKMTHRHFSPSLIAGGHNSQPVQLLSLGKNQVRKDELAKLEHTICILGNRRNPSIITVNNRFSHHQCGSFKPNQQNNIPTTNFSYACQYLTLCSLSVSNGQCGGLRPHSHRLLHHHGILSLQTTRS